MARSLFSSGPRPDRGPAPYAISEYAALDRNPHSAAERIRALLDEWWAELPPAAAAQVRERFGDQQDIKHRGAFLELYLHRLGLALGYEVDNDIGNDANGRRRPDLLWRSGTDEIYVEATALTGDDVGDRVVKQRLDVIHDAVDAVNAPAFSADLEITAHGDGTPSAKKITKAVQRFLDRLDPDEELASLAAGGARKQLEYSTGGWTLLLEADPLQREHRDYPHHRVLAGGAGGADEIDDITPLRRKLKDKAGRYGDLGKPYVVALLCAGTFVEDRDIEQALMGPIEHWRDPATGTWQPGRRPDGVWLGPAGPINTRLSAVLTLPQLHPATTCAVQPTLWLNPNAAHPITDPGPWRRMEPHPNHLAVEHPATATVAEILGLPERWPHEELDAAA